MTLLDAAILALLLFLWCWDYPRDLPSKKPTTRDAIEAGRTLIKDHFGDTFDIHNFPWYFFAANPDVAWVTSLSHSTDYYYFGLMVIRENGDSDLTVKYPWDIYGNLGIRF
jgi:hypothetical protein